MFDPLIKTSGHLAMSGLPIERKRRSEIARWKHGFEDQGSLGSYGFLSCESEIDRTDWFRFLRFMNKGEQRASNLFFLSRIPGFCKLLSLGKVITRRIKISVSPFISDIQTKTF